MKSEPNCASCGAAMHGYFCSHCGEKQHFSRDHSLRHYLQEAVHVITHVDSRVLRSVAMLIARPGFLSREFLQGRHVRYMTPLRLFFLISVGYYIALSALHSGTLHAIAGMDFNTFVTPLAVQLHGNDFYPRYAQRQVDRKMRRERIDYASLERAYDEKTVVFSKTLVFLLIPFIALLFWALFFRKRHYVAEHLVIATHFWSFALLLFGVLLPAVLLPVSASLKAMGVSTAALVNDQVLSALLQVVLAAYLFLMLRRVYEVKAWYAGLIAVSLSWSFFFIIWLFRFFLFVVTLRAI